KTDTILGVDNSKQFFPGWRRRGRVAPEYPVGFIGPEHVFGTQIALEAADLGAPLRTVEIVPAVSKLVLNGFQLGDVDVQFGAAAVFHPPLADHDASAIREPQLDRRRWVIMGLHPIGEPFGLAADGIDIPAGIETG